MTKKIALSSFILLGSFLVSSFAYSDVNQEISSKKACENMTNLTAPHCAYSVFDAPPEKTTTGKYIKITFPVYDSAIVRCMAKDSIQYDVDAVIEDGIKQGYIKVGDNILVQYEQCADLRCTKTNGKVQNDQYKLFQADEYHYTTQPNLFAVQIDRHFGSDCEAKYSVDNKKIHT